MILRIGSHDCIRLPVETNELQPLVHTKPRYGKSPFIRPIYHLPLRGDRNTTIDRRTRDQPTQARHSTSSVYVMDM
ncbi:hypothetical protein KSS87_023250, partial [Heliosperma pusillum]